MPRPPPETPISVSASSPRMVSTCAVRFCGYNAFDFSLLAPSPSLSRTFFSACGQRICFFIGPLPWGHYFAENSIAGRGENAYCVPSPANRPWLRTEGVAAMQAQERPLDKKIIREELKTKRNRLLERFFKDPSNTRFAVEIRHIDDQIACLTEHLTTLKRSGVD